MSTPESDLAIDQTVVTREHTDDDGRRFRDAVAGLRTGASRIKISERMLMVIGGIIAPLGLVFIVLGWWGASRTSNTFEQIPYLISGGLLGLGLVILGGFFYFAHWMTEMVKENRRHSQEVLGALAAMHHDLRAAIEGTQLAGDLSRNAPRRGVPPADESDAVLYATQRGSMAHRADCVVIMGKHDLRHVVPEDGFSACKLCDPFDSP